MTIIMIILLLAGGMSFYDACIHAFGTAGGTGGFSSKNTSIGYYNSAYIDYVISVGMLVLDLTSTYFIFYF